MRQVVGVCYVSGDCTVFMMNMETSIMSAQLKLEKKLSLITRIVDKSEDNWGHYSELTGGGHSRRLHFLQHGDTSLGIIIFKMIQEVALRTTIS